MKRHVSSLWLLFWSALIGGINAFLPGVVPPVAGLIGSLLSIIAVVRLSSRNNLFWKAKYFLIASIAILLLTMLSSFLEWMIISIIILSFAATALNIIYFFCIIYGLAGMAEDAFENAHAQRLRRLFPFRIILSVIPILLNRNFVITIAIYIAQILFTVYQLYLYRRSIQIEQTFVGRLQEEA